ncbi:exosortase-dependent surface protein XDP1 [Paraglaciecola sp. L3A3]|uniref:exosortase-dependent surface protein XDP1 n=1 Tax=Paraglaciecola sp. L3A3 TaxID=2686358 RepID=UPI00131DECC0|nr:exosortase-dependent surface protein XDP1 [Paraglaciecola sp. L3A3]
MKLLNKIILIGAALGFTNSVYASCTAGSAATLGDTWAGANTYDLYQGTCNGGSNVSSGTGTSGGFMVDGVSIKVSAWSDTGGGGSDDIIESADIAGPWLSNGEVGYGILNDDENNFDNHANAHTIDNQGSAADYDMLLFSFSEAVSLSGATFSWLGSTNNQQVTAVGLNNITDLTSGNKTWSNINGSSSLVDKGSFSINAAAGVYKSDFTTTQAAQYWLVGAYNTAFGYVSGFTTKDDSFKLASIGFVKETTPPTDNVNAPNSFAVLLLGGGLIALRRRKAK